MKLKVLNKQNNSGDCIICGVNNPLSVKASFYEVEGEYIVATAVPRNEHQSYPNRMHGGMISALLDETVGRAIMITKPDQWGVTSELNVKFRKPVPLDKQIFCVGKVVKERGMTFLAKGIIEDEDGTLLAHGYATYVKLPLDKIAETQDVGWVKIEDDVTEFDIKNIDYLNEMQC